MMSPHMPKHIDLLVVDSEVEDYRKITAEFAEADITLQLVTDGHHALQVASGKDVRLWISNMYLPDMSGIELLRITRVKRQSTPFYLVSNDYSPEEERKARAAGAAGYLTKPADSTWFEICRSTLVHLRARASPPPKEKPSVLSNATHATSYPTFSHKES